MIQEQLTNGRNYLEPQAQAVPNTVLGAKAQFAWLRVEPVEGGFIVEAVLPDGSVKKSIAPHLTALGRLLRDWGGQFAKPKKPSA